MFDRTSITQSRKQSGLTQSQLADLLDVPVNTLSRWETGAATPDGNALAAIHSIATEHGVTPKFFKRVPNVGSSARKRTKLVFAWDFQNLGFAEETLEEEWKFIDRYLRLLHPGTVASRQFIAYTSAFQWQATERLAGLGFEVEQGAFNADSQLIDDVSAACTKRPARTVFYLAANDGNYAELLRELRNRDVEVHILGSDRCSERLLGAIDKDHFVHVDRPFVVANCIDVIRRLGGEPISKARFGIECRNALDDAAIYPSEVGFSKKNPYGSVLRWLEIQGLVKVNHEKGPGDRIKVTLVARK